MLLFVGIPGDRAHRLLGASDAGPTKSGIGASVHSDCAAANLLIAKCDTSTMF